MAVNRTLLVGLAGWLVTFCSCTPPPKTTVNLEQQMELRTLSSQLSDPAISAQTKLEAAQLLLTRPYPHAAEQLQNFLRENGNPLAQIAVARAIAARGGGDEAFVGPLMAMLRGSEESVRAPAASALVTYHGNGVMAELTQIAVDRTQPVAIRLVTVSALGSVLDKGAVDTLVGLLDDEDSLVNRSAADALVKLTNIRAFGADREQWKQWWRNNRDKPRSRWLADLADNLVRAKEFLEADNARLRERLAVAMEDVYAAASVQRRQTLLLAYIKDPLADVRLAGLSISTRRLFADPKNFPAELAMQIEASLEDTDSRVRLAAALLVASLAREQAAALLLDRLNREKVQTVRQGLLTAIGRLKAPKALPAVLEAISDTDAQIAAAAATALAGIVGKQPLTDDMKSRAVKVLSDRYRQNGMGANGAHLREELLTAMGAVKDAVLAEILRQSLKDSAATVRLAAVNGLARFGDAAFAGSLVDLTTDSDRGIRQAAIAALGALDGAKHLERILERTRTDMEEDAAVRNQAWEVVMTILQPADAETLWSVSESLEKRNNASEQRIKIYQMLVERLVEDKDPLLPRGRRRLAHALMLGARPAEAAAQLSQAYPLLQQTGSDQAAAAWLEWIEALLAAGDVTVIKMMSEEKDDSAFNEAWVRLESGLRQFAAGDKCDRAIEIGLRAVKTLDKRLDNDKKMRISRILTEARAKQALADRLLVAQLVGKLIAKDSAEAKAASEALKGMGDRAVLPLVGELEKLVSSGKPDPLAEKAIVTILAQVAPQLPPYNVESPQADRMKLIDAWRKMLAAGN